MKKIVWTVIIVALVLVIGQFALGKSGKNSSSDMIKIGVMIPMSGNAASFGESASAGFQLAAEEINAKGGIKGKKIQYIIEDSKCNPKDALTAVQKLVNVDGVKFVAGAVCSSEVLAAIPVTEEAKVVFMGQGSSPDITGKGKYFLRTFPSDLLSADAMAQKLVKDYKNISIISEKTDYALALDRVFKEKLASLGSKVVASEQYTSDTTDFRSNIAKIKQANPDVIFVNAQSGPTAARIAKQVREAGIKAKLAAVYLSGDDFVASSNATEGTLIVDFPTLNASNTQARAFLDSQAKKGLKVSYPFIAAQAYDQVYLLAQAMVTVGEDNKKINDYLHNLNDYSGVIGKFRFDNNGDVQGIGLSYKTIKDGKLVELSLN